MSKKYVVKGNNIDSEIQHELVMVNVDLGKYFSMNEIAAVIWKSLKTPKSINELCEICIDQYDVDEAQCSKEIEDFVVSLKELNLIQETD